MIFERRTSAVSWLSTERPHQYFRHKRTWKMKAARSTGETSRLLQSIRTPKENFGAEEKARDEWMDRLIHLKQQMEEEMKEPEKGK